MEESITYQEIKGIGKLETAREFVLVIGADRFGAPDDATKIKINAISDIKRLRDLGVRISHVATWQELLELVRG